MSTSSCPVDGLADWSVVAAPGFAVMSGAAALGLTLFRVDGATWSLVRTAVRRAWGYVLLLLFIYSIAAVATVGVVLALLKDGAAASCAAADHSIVFWSLLGLVVAFVPGKASIAWYWVRVASRSLGRKASGEPKRGRDFTSDALMLACRRVVDQLLDLRSRDGVILRLSTRTRMKDLTRSDLELARELPAEAQEYARVHELDVPDYVQRRLAVIRSYPRELSRESLVDELDGLAYELCELGWTRSLEHVLAADGTRVSPSSRARQV